jgi:2,4-dienoyl-CoA reductase-like NADH-dependent reductase (Old Yellow Enzyme family)
MIGEEFYAHPFSPLNLGFTTITNRAIMGSMPNNPSTRQVTSRRPSSGRITHQGRSDSASGHSVRACNTTFIFF